MSSSALEKSVEKSLLNLNREQSLKDLFWSQLNYDRVNKELSRRNWSDRVADELAENPLLLASGGNNNDFRVIYSRFKSDRLLKQKEREVVNNLLKDNPYSLFVFSNEARSQWHFLNVKYDDSPQKRKLFRRIKVEAGDNQLRTATEQLSKLDLESFNSDSPLEIQKQHDEAFDVEVVTQKFFSEYRQVFQKVENLIEGINLSEKKRLYTQKLFNRLMFIGFIQKKGWLTYNGDKDYLSALWKAYCKEQTKQSNFYRDRLSHLFFAGLNNPQQQDLIGINNGGFLKDLIGTVPYLNGGLFEQDDEDNDSKIIIPDECIDSILHDLFQKFAFTVTESTPLDVEVAVDPEMLGKVFEELVTGRHESGSYYTPKPIVSFMCRESLKGYLKTQNLSTTLSYEEREQAIALLVDEQNPEKIDHPEAVLEALKKVRTCDLACGSGAYLLGMLHELLDLRQCLESSIESISLLPRGTKGDSAYQHKLEIIQNNLYGVDIDVFAVNIARLRLWLSLAVDYEGEKPKPLPNLKYKIEVGDSLISPNPTEIKLTDVLIEKYREVKAEYIKAHDGNQKKDLEKEITQLKKDISLITYGKAPLDKGGSGGFDWSLDFAEVFADGGFDIVVANPPYVRADAQFKHLEHNEQLRQIAIAEYQNQRKKLKDSKIYKTLYEKWDLYIPFLERAYQILIDKGQMIFIISDAYNAAKYTKKSHEFFLKNSCIERIDFCSDIPIFNAGVYNTIVYFSKAQPNLSHQPIRVRRWGNNSDDFNLNEEYLSTTDQCSANLNTFKIQKYPTVNFSSKYELLKLEDICYVSKGMVIHSNEKLAKGLFKLNNLLSNSKDEFHSKPFVEGKDLDKWLVSSHKWLEWGTNRAPSLFSRPTFPELYNHENKLLLAKVGSIRAVFDVDSFYCNEGVYVCLPWHYLKGICNNSIKKVTRYKIETPIRLDLPKREELEDNSKNFDIKYLLAVINSKVAANFLNSTRRNNVQLYPDDWKKLPIPKADVKQQNEIAKLVDKILLLKHNNSTKDVSAIEFEIDDRVAALYGL